MENFKIEAIGHALIEGERALEGLQPSKDSVWGVISLDDDVYTFSGRRTGRMRYKKAFMDTALKQFDRKVAGKDGKDYSYVELPVDSVQVLEKEIEIVGFVKSTYDGLIKAINDGKVQPAAKQRVKKSSKVVIVDENDEPVSPTDEVAVAIASQTTEVKEDTSEQIVEQEA